MAEVKRETKNEPDGTDDRMEFEFDGKIFQIVRDIKGRYWLEIDCANCGETFGTKLPRFCNHKCFGESLEKGHRKEKLNEQQTK